MSSSRDKNGFFSTVTAKSMPDYFEKQSFEIVDLPDSVVTGFVWPTAIVGTDPVISTDELKKYRSESEIVLLATSGMRAVSIACALSGPSHIPKIILIDHSWKVCFFWRHMTAFMANDTLAETEGLFFDNLMAFIKENSALILGSPYDAQQKTPSHSESAEPLDLGDPHQSTTAYFKQLFDLYGYQYVRRVILNASVCMQSFADTNAIQKIKTQLSQHGLNKIYAYLSNIVASTENAEERNRILENISTLNPVLSIHTDMCLPTYMPMHVYFLTDQHPENVLQALFSADQAYRDILTPSRRR